MPNTSYSIPGNDRIPDYDSTLEIEVDDKYEAFSKTIPEPSAYEGGLITWFNNFGIREKTSGIVADVPYTVTLQALPKGKQLFVFYDGFPHLIPTESAGPNQIRFSLSIGDPPTGSYP